MLESIVVPRKNDSLLPMNNQCHTRYTLLMRARDPADVDAWQEFVTYYREFIRMVLFQMNLKSPDVDDLIQEILIKIWKSLPEHEYNKERARFRTWLSRLIRNQVVDHMRSNQSRSKKHTAFFEKEVEGQKVVAEPAVEEIIEKEWEVYVVQLALKNIESLFSSRAIEAFTMSVDGKTAEEIAMHLGVKPNSVIKLKNRVKERLMVEIRHLRSELEIA